MANQIIHVCQKCPTKVHCCKFRYKDGFTFIGKKDAEKIKKKYGLDYKDFMYYRKFTKRVADFMKNESRNSEGFMRYNQMKDRKLPVLITKKNGDCIFLENNKCSIYEDRPLLCQLYPYWFDHKLQIIKHDKNTKCKFVNEKFGRVNLKKDKIKKYVKIAKQIINEEY